MKNITIVFLCLLMITSLMLAEQNVVSDKEATSSDATATVKLTLRIRDAKSGLDLEAHMNVPKNTRAFKAMSRIVQVKPERGGFITELCGVKATGKEKFWALNVNGEPSKVGINLLKLEEDTVILWQTRERK